MKTFRASLRLLGFILTLIWHATPLWIRAALGPINWDHHQAVRQKFAKNAMKVLGIKLSVEGQTYKDGPAIYASNHRSWLDPFVDLSVVWAFPVAKAEVGKLPFVAQGAKATGILFVDRGSRSSRQAIIDEMKQALSTGFSILIYPEGTTSTEVATRAFKRGAWAVAKDAKVPIVPMAIVYPNPSYHWGDGESLWKNFVQVAGEKQTKVRLFFGDPLFVDEADIAMEQTKKIIDEIIISASAKTQLA